MPQRLIHHQVAAPQTATSTIGDICAVGGCDRHEARELKRFAQNLALAGRLAEHLGAAS